MISPIVEYILLVFITFLVAVIVSQLLKKIINYLIEKNSELLNVNPTNFIFLRNAIAPFVYGVAIIWVFYNIPYFHSLGKAMFAGAGVLAAIIGFATQKAFSNIISGIFILLFKPFRVGDVIQIDSSKKGIVEEITLRHIILKDYEYRRIIIPNNLINEKVIVNSSLTDEKIRKHIEVSVGYDSDLDLAMDLLRNIVHDHELSIDNRTQEEIDNAVLPEIVKVIELGDYGILIRVYVWVRNNQDAFDLKCDVLYQIKKEYAQNNIEIPYPYQNNINLSKKIS